MVSNSRPSTFAFHILVVLALSTFLFSQSTSSTGSIQGIVVDQTGAVVSGAKVRITRIATGQVVNVVTTSAGAYTSGALTPGDYIVHVEAAGFKSAELPLNVQVGVTTAGSVKLQVGQANQVVEVQASEIQVNTEQATVQGVLTSQQIENLPVNGRNFLDLAQLEPGVQIQDGGNFDPTKNGFSSISFGGRYGRTARIEVDGLDISDETVGTTTQNIPEGAIQEFQIEQSSLDLSTELTSSGAVNVTTKSGTNAYHGEGYYYFRDQALNANLPGASDNYFQRNQYGVSAGGPIIHDKLFFFISAERTKQDLLNPVLPSGPFQALVGSFDSPFREAEGVGRLDWQINNRYKFFYRFSFDQNRSVLAIIPNSFQPFANNNHTPVHAFGLDFNTGGFTHSIRFGYTKFRNQITDAVGGSPIFNPAPSLELAIGSDPECLTPGANVFCSGPGFLAPQQTYQSNRQIKYDGSKAVGAHILRYGGGYNHVFGGGSASFLALAPAVGAGIGDCGSVCLALPGGAANPLNYPANSITLGNGQGFGSEIPAFGFPAGGLGPDNRISLYFGDSWKLKPNLTLTYGVRYVRDSGRTDSDLAAIPALEQFGAGLGNRVHQPNANFAPQLGVAWDPGRTGKTVLRAGIGLFYENAVWNNVLFDRPARLPSGLFLITPTVCSNGTGGTFTLPGGQVQNWAPICGQPIGQAASQISALQAQYQAATLSAGPASNAAFIGNALSDGLDATGTDLFAPNYVSPRSLQMNFGIQHELRRGMVFSVDYLRNIETHTLLAIDTNHVGDARYFNKANAAAAINTTLANCGVAGPNAINLAIANCPNNPVTGAPGYNQGATIADFASNGLDSGYSLCSGAPCASVGEPGAAFPGINQNLGTNQMLFPSGRAVYNALQLSLKGNIRQPFKRISNLDLLISYSYSKFVAPAVDNDYITIATDFNDPLHYIGPNGLDRRHQVSFGATMDLPWSFRLGMIGHFYSPLPVTLTLPTSGNAGGIFQTDLTGDGTGDGSFASNGGTGDVLPGTNIGSFGRGVKASNLNSFIIAYNQNFAGQPTPAGQMLVSNGLFTLGQLQALGGVQQLIPLAPAGQSNMDWLRAFDLNLSWIYKVRERFEIHPAVSFFNVLNFANFDGPANPLSGVLSGTPGSVNGTSGQQPNSNRLGLGSGVFALGAPRALEFSVKVTF
ncbi:MAG: carboxypeptidase regulatory-like domain-containing protein [Terriglobales bacterium]